jgi:hypothetical protein
METTEQPQPRRRWATRAQAAAHISVHPSTIDRLATDGRLTRYKMAEGSVARYDLDELDALLKPSGEPTDE